MAIITLPTIRILSLAALVILGATATRAGSAFDEASTLLKANDFPAAQAAFEKLAAAEPRNAAVFHQLGIILQRRGDEAALAKAVTALEKASLLDPSNGTYLADFGGASLQLANRTRSLGAATRGRDAMEKAIRLDPDNLDAREGLYRFYDEAPWPLGNAPKARAQLLEIARRDAGRGMMLEVVALADARRYDEAFKRCEEVLAANPASYAALYQFGRTAVLAARSQDRAIALLTRCLELPAPPAYPGHGTVAYRIGQLHEQKADPAAARIFYARAVALDPANAAAAAALARLPEAARPK